jgi:hypothetical protein
MKKALALGFAVALLTISPIRAKDALDASGSPFLPNPTRTPGATNPDITQENIRETICNHGHWSTKSIRPPASYTNKLKREQIAEYGYDDTSMKDYEEDHLIPLTVGGNPRDPKNLWPEPWDGDYGAHIKDKLENQLNKMVCDGSLTLKEAQTAIRTNWIEAYKKYIGQEAPIVKKKKRASHHRRAPRN